jgi:hypothetical protein
MSFRTARRALIAALLLAPTFLAPGPAWCFPVVVHSRTPVVHQRGPRVHIRSAATRPNR